jgi:hypothetical protein
VCGNSARYGSGGAISVSFDPAAYLNLDLTVSSDALIQVHGQGVQSRATRSGSSVGLPVPLSRFGLPCTTYSCPRPPYNAGQSRRL